MLFLLFSPSPDIKQCQPFMLYRRLWLTILLYGSRISQCHSLATGYLHRHTWTYNTRQRSTLSTNQSSYITLSYQRHASSFLVQCRQLVNRIRIIQVLTNHKTNDRRGVCRLSSVLMKELQLPMFTNVHRMVMFQILRVCLSVCGHNN